MALGQQQQAYISLKQIYLELLGKWGYNDEVKFLMQDLDGAWHKLSKKEQEELRAHFEQELKPKISKKKT